jgi:hypothetical protein
MRALIVAAVCTIALTEACGTNSPSSEPPAKNGGSAPGSAGSTGSGGRAPSGGGAGNATLSGGGAGTGGSGAVAASSSGGATAGGSSVHGAAGAPIGAGGGGANGGVQNGGPPNGSAASAGAPGGAPSAGAAGANTGGSSAGSGTGGAANGGSGGAGAVCTRDALQPLADSVAAALGAMDATKMPLAAGATYTENFATTAFTAGIWQSALVIAFRRDFLDVVTCQTFSEIVVTQGHPYVIGIRTKSDGSMISEVESIVTDQGDWSFDANGYLTHAEAEDWSVIPVAQQDTRDTLMAAANAYFALFNDMSVAVPWGMPCARLEGGGAYTGTSCDVGVPSGITFADIHFVIDQDLGTAVAFDRFGGANGLPDIHIFRLLNGKIRYVHTLTVCTTPNCGM